MKTFIASLFVLLSLFSANISHAADRIVLGIGTPYGEDVRWVPGHWYHGYWIPGHYVEYAGSAPGTGFIWVEGGLRDGGRHWHHGRWHRHHRD